MPIRDGYVHEYNQSHFRLEAPALHLVSLILADKELKRAYRQQLLPFLEEFAEEEKESEIIRLCIEIATSFRLMYWNATKKSDAGRVGELCQDQTNDQWQALSMLEACHKVIHAEFFAFETRKLPKTHHEYFQPRIHLAGKKGNKEWLAVVDVLQFANAAIQPVDPPF